VTPLELRDSTPLHLRSLRVEVLRARVDDGVAMSFAPLRHRTMVLITVEGVDGTVGRGESWVNFPSWAPMERVATLVEGVAPVLREHPVGTIAEHYGRLVARLAPLGRQWGAPGPIAQAISGVDVALWDLAARTHGVPVVPAGSRVREQVTAYASSLGPTGHLESLERALAAGYRAVKVKIGFDEEADRSALRLVRERAGEEIEIYVDANQAWTVEQAASMVPALRDVGAAWLEEPVRGDRLVDLVDLYERTGFPLATGENLYGVQEFERYIGSGALHVIQPDVTKMGGLTPALAVAEAAAGTSCLVAPHLYNGALAYAATLQLAAMAPAVRLLENDVRHNDLRDSLIVDPPTLVDGSITIPDGPGLGVELDEEQLARFRVSETVVDLTSR
jgi:L-alanine-DL-glutamate epimerase-like enolase superfamily enzyme